MSKDTVTKNKRSGGKGSGKKARSRAEEIWHSIRRNKGAMLGLIFLCILILIIIYSLLFISFEDIMSMDNESMLPPSSEHPFGTDDMGRDMFKRVLYGTRYSLVIGVVAVAAAMIIGVIVGAIAGYFGGKVDNLLMRANDIISSIPSILLGMVIVTVLGQSLRNLIIAVAVPSICVFARITRASVLTVRGQEYVEAAKAIGMSNLRIIFSEVVPNGLSPIIVTATTMIGNAITVAASLSFLGFGVPLPTPEWGALVSGGRSLIKIAPYLSTFPGLFIMATVLAFNIMGDGLRDALDPKLKR